MTESATVRLMDRAFDRARLVRLADGLAIAVAVSLPWSTSLTGILIALWLLAVLPTIDPPTMRRSIVVFAAAAPMLLFAFALVGMAWSEAPFAERLGGLKSFVRLLAFPLLFIQFQRSERGLWFIVGYLASCTALLAMSWLQFVLPQIQLSPCPPVACRAPGVPVKDYIVQSGEFLICAFGLAHLAVSQWQSDHKGRAVALLLLASAFLANIAFVATGRSTLVIFAVLLPLFGFQRFGWKGMFAIVIAGAALSAAVWTTSPFLRGRILSALEEVRQYEAKGGLTSAGYRLEFWKKSAEIFVDAPVIGHGTGSTEEMFRRAAIDKDGISAVVTDNPHNQVLIVAVQLGLVGVALLAAVWLTHLLLFSGGGLIGWIGFGVVVHNIVAGLFNAYLFEFTLGWTYVFGVGVLGGMILRARGGGPDAATGANKPSAADRYP